MDIGLDTYNVQDQDKIQVQISDPRSKSELKLQIKDLGPVLKSKIQIKFQKMFNSRSEVKSKTLNKYPGTDTDTGPVPRPR